VNHVSLYLDRGNLQPAAKEKAEDDIAFQFKVWIVDRKGCKRVMKGKRGGLFSLSNFFIQLAFERCFWSNKKPFGWADYIAKDVLLFESNGLLNEGNLTICCEVCGLFYSIS